MNADQIPFYEPHPGTIKISGATESIKAAKCALHYLGNQVSPIDFFYIGANAGQQAMKAMGIFRYLVEQTAKEQATVLFQPNRVRTRLAQPIGGTVSVIDAVYWRAYLFNRAELDNAALNYGKDNLDPTTEPPGSG